MKSSLPTPRNKSESQKLAKLSEILSEVPVTITSDGREVVAQGINVHYDLGSFPLRIPRESVVTVHDSDLCTFDPNGGTAWDSLRTKYDARIFYTRPAIRTRTRRTNRYGFLIIFND